MVSPKASQYLHIVMPRGVPAGGAMEAQFYWGAEAPGVAKGACAATSQNVDN
ncbi:MAG: hypothetical protein Q7J27_06065 [Syntrophales bacterium]|nr:hypothetical protein [Syntrophales bacterium]